MSGRFNRGTDQFDPPETWPALYTSLAEHVALGERIRHTDANNLANLAGQRLSRLRINLHLILNLCTASGCDELAVAGLDLRRLCHPRHYEPGQQIASAVRVSAEALLVPSCTRFPEGNLIVFPDRLHPGSTIDVAETQDPDLFVDWASLS